MNTLRLLFYIILVLVNMSVDAQNTVRLWPVNPPTNNDLKESETYDKTAGWLTNVSVPEISIYLPEQSINTGMAVIICPGGGYGGLAIDHEGVQFAEWLNKKGIAGIVLKYRMPNKHKKVPLDDARQAIRYIRGQAKELRINENKIGIAGFSAGGHLAATASTYPEIAIMQIAGDNSPNTFSNISAKPDFSILFYPVITMEIATHGGSRSNLLGDNPSIDDVERYSNEKQVDKYFTPPTILLLSDDDTSVSPLNSTMYYDALKKQNILATMYIFPEGGHGWGMRKNFKYHEQMLGLLEMWLKDIQNKQ